MAKVGPQRAADLTGRSKSTVQRAMKAGKLSYEIDNSGRRVIDVSELDRVFGLAPLGSETAVPSSVTVENELEKAASIIETERMKMRVRMLEDQIEAARDQIEDLKDQRDQWQKQAQQVLITSQYSQKQAEELKEELKERDRRAQMRRQVEMQRRGQAESMIKPEPARKAVADNVKNVEGRKIGPFGRQRQQAAAHVVTEEEAVVAAAPAKSFDIQSLWQKIRGESVANTETTPNTKATA